MTSELRILVNNSLDLRLSKIFFMENANFQLGT